MTDESSKKDTLKVANPGKLSLTKTIESGKVKQNFTHGRSKSVTVEVKRTRTFQQGSAGMVEVKPAFTPPGHPSSPMHAAGDRHLTQDEQQARLKALKTAEENFRQAPPPVPRRADVASDDAAPEAAETAADERPEASSGIVRPKKPIGVEAARDKTNVNLAAPLVANPNKPARTLTTPADEPEDRSDKSGKGGKLKLRSGDERRAGGKITVVQALSNIEDSRVRSLASMRRQREKAMKKAMGVQTPTEKVIRDVVIPEAITVQELANRMAERAVDVIRTLMKLGVMATANQSIDADTAELVVGEFGHKFKRVTEGDVENIIQDDAVEPEGSLQPRPPVVTIMGHVDHGKTSLLDSLRKTDVVAKEAGGITQHIGAYQVTVASGNKITFLDTPGHEAFTAMRARGAKITDIVILVVAADDGIMAQTKEAISHAKAAGVPIIVAVNKIDKPGADANRVKQELMQHDLVPEEFGGDVMVVEVSAKTGQGLDKLVETILLQAEVLELKANPDRAAAGVVVEAKLDQGKGVVTTVLMQKGSLNVGDVVVAGPAYGKVRMLIDDKGEPLKTAIPGMPVQLLGLNIAPEAGDSFSVVENEKTARDIAEYRARRIREQNVVASARTMDSLFGEAAGTNAKELPVIVKGDVQGSVEAIVGSLAKFTTDEVTVRALHSGVGGITESDITLAKATGAMIIAFNVRATPKAKEIASREQINIRYYSIIYNVVDDVKAALSGMLSPTLQENFLGYAEIREVFNITKSGKVAGCMVTDGVIKRGCKVRLLRDSVVIHEGTLKTLKRFKDEVKEVKNGLECGMAFENYEDIRVGDQIECFEVEEVARTV
ncbi:MAG: translation initiation factor IF-2 [Alphaproteobacteria bacterium]|nr:translation initiation factor IF-2 [Alphaproteobacteria bacterium]